MSKNNTIGVKFKFQNLPGVPDNQKLTAPKFNELVDFQNSPVQQIAGSLNDTDIIIDGTKNYATTIVVAGATRAITANASGHLQGNNIKQRYTFNVDCTLTLTNFDTPGNNTGTITPIPAGTYDFQYLANRNGRNLLIEQNAFSLINGNVTTANGKAVDLGGTGTKTTFLDGTNLIDFIIGGWNEIAKAWKSIRIYAKNYFYATVNNNGAYIELSETGGGASSILNLFSEEDINIQADGKVNIDSPESEFIGQAHANTAADVIKGTTSTPEFDFSKGNDHQMDVESNVSSFTTTNEKGSANYKVYLINDGTPGRTVAAPVGDGPTAWTADTTSETHTTAADAINLYQFYTLPDGSKYFNLHIVKS